MPRGAYSSKNYPPAKTAKTMQVDDSPRTGMPFLPSKPVRSNTDSKFGLRTPTFLSRNNSETKLSIVPESRLAIIPEPQYSPRTSSLPPKGIEISIRPTTSRTSSTESDDSNSIGVAQSIYNEDLSLQETQSNTSSLYSLDSTSIYSKDSSSIYSSASSVYSSSASIYSFDSENGDTLNPLRYQGAPRVRPVIVKTLEPLDAAAKEASTLAKKASVYKNSKLPPNIPTFTTSLQQWSMICRAAQASLDCYDSCATTRKGVYTPANTGKDIKAMIIDSQQIDGKNVIIIAIRGTQLKSLTDWAVNKAHKPEKPVGFLDDEENACHAGFLQVTKAMIEQVATQLGNHPVTQEKPDLVFTGHSAGGAVAAMLYSHMLSTSVSSSLTELAGKFSSINAITFGAPPLSLSPLPRREHGNGVLLSFANEGDPIVRFCDAPYLKSLAKLMTASPPPPPTPTTAPKVKVVRRSRGTSVIREDVVETVVAWEDRPVWPTPRPGLCNAGQVVLMRDEDGRAVSRFAMEEELKDVIFGDLKEHGTDAYMRRVKEVALAAMTGL